jgi:hypothetical protein
MPREVSMKSIPYLLAFVLFLFLQPVRAQDGDGDEDDPEIEIGEGDGGGDLTEEDEDELRKIRKKNSGLAGGGREDDGDADAPKVKLSLQTRINKAIKKGVAWLKRAQLKDGSWGPVRANSHYGDNKGKGKPRQPKKKPKPGVWPYIRDPSGPTSWSIYTLSKCDVKKTDPVIKKGYKWLHSGRKMLAEGASERGQTGQTWGPGKAWDVTGDKSRHYSSSTYESASLVMMIEAMNERSAKLTKKHRKRRLYSKNPLKPPTGSKIPKDDWKWMHDRVVWLTVGRRGKRTIKGTQNIGGGWRYGQANGQADLSSTQFCLLGLRAASQAGYPVTKVAPNCWLYAAKYCKSLQTGNGGFGYQKGQGSNASMTACGVGSLVICREQMQLANQEVPSWIDTSIKRGLAHLDEVFDATRNMGKGGGKEHHYYLYSVERVGDLTGRTEFAGKNWYVRGAEYLLSHQDADGKWVQNGFPPHDVLGTCFALLFLKRATPPVVTVSDRDR